MWTDPFFWFAVCIWLVVLLFALGLCAAAAWGDRLAEQARRDVLERAELERDIGGYRR